MMVRRILRTYRNRRPSLRIANFRRGLAPCRSQPRRGLVLLSVIVCLMVTATALVSVARQSYRAGTTAVRARRNLQQKWGAESLRRAMLPIAEPIFQVRDEALRRVKPPHPPAQLAAQLVLGDTKFEVLLADENARANVNALFHFGGPQKAAATIRELSGAIGGVRLDPEVNAIGAEQMIDVEDGLLIDQAKFAFRSWGQVFDVTRLANLPAATSQLTCWGNTSLNLRRATDETAIAVASMVLPKASARRLVMDYRRNRVNEIANFIPRYAKQPRQRLMLKHLLSESSVCYSLWVRSTQLADVRSSFAVIAPDREGSVHTTEFEYRGP